MPCAKFATAFESLNGGQVAVGMILVGVCPPSTLVNSLRHHDFLYAGIIHIGEDIPCPVDADGRFTSEVAEFSGRCGLESCSTMFNTPGTTHHASHCDVHALQQLYATDVRGKGCPAGYESILRV